MEQTTSTIYISLIFVAFGIIFISMISFLLYNDSEFFTDKVNDIVFHLFDSSRYPVFYATFILFDCGTLADCMCCYSYGIFALPDCYECKEGLVFIALQFLAWFIHISICLLFVIFFGLCCSVSFFIHTLNESYPGKIHLYPGHKPETFTFLFTNEHRRKIESKQGCGKSYLKHLSKSQDLLIKICCLHHYLYSQPVDPWRKPYKKLKTYQYPNTDARQYLAEKYANCYLDVTWESLYKKIKLLKESPKNTNSNYKFKSKVLSFHDAWVGFVDYWHFDTRFTLIMCGLVVFLWFVCQLTIQILSILSYSEYLNNVNIIEFDDNDYEYSMFLLHNGLGLWALLMRLIWFISFCHVCYQHYWYLYYTRLLYHEPINFVDYQKLEKDYSRVLESIVVAKVLQEYHILNQDLRNIIMDYHNTMILNSQ